MATHVLPAAEIDQHQTTATCDCGPVTTDRTYTHRITGGHRCTTCGCRIAWSDGLRMWLHDITAGTPCDEATPGRQP